MAIAPETLEAVTHEVNGLLDYDNLSPALRKKIKEGGGGGLSKAEVEALIKVEEERAKTQEALKLAIASNLSDVNSKATSRENLETYKIGDAVGYKTPIRMLSLSQYLPTTIEAEKYYIMAGQATPATTYAFTAITNSIFVPWNALSSLYEFTGRTLKFQLTLSVATEEAGKPECNFTAKVGLITVTEAKYTSAGSLGTVKVTEPGAGEIVVATTNFNASAGLTLGCMVKASAVPKKNVHCSVTLDAVHE